MSLVPSLSFPGSPVLLTRAYLSAGRRALGLMALVCLLGGCEDDNPAGPDSPSVTIAAPAPGSSLLEGSDLQLQGSAVDPQEGAIPGDFLVWSSSIDGFLGLGETLTVPDPSVGIHTITLVAEDSKGNRGSANVSVAVEELEFLDGTVSDPQIGLVVASLGNALRLFQVGSPEETRDVPLGASSTVTATSLSVRGERAVVPLGNAASVASIDLRSQQIEGFYLFPEGNVSGSDFVDDETVLVANQETDMVGKFPVGTGGGTIAETVTVAPFPNDVITYSASRVLVVSSNLDDFYAPAGEGVVTAINPIDMTITGTVNTGGTNPQFGALGPNGLLYVANTGNYVDPSTLAVIDPETMTRVDLIEGFGPGSGDVHVDGAGLVYVSGFFFGTLVWDSTSRAFVRGVADPICAPLDGGGCRGAFSSYTGADGTLYQAFFGSSFQDLPPWIFEYDAGTFELTDSIAPGLGPMAIEIHSFR